MKGLCLVVGIFITGIVAHAQTALEYPGRPRYPDGLLSLSAGYGLSKYSGDFSDGLVDRAAVFRGAFAVLPELSVGLGAQVGSLSYTRRSRRNMEATYAYQFGTENLIRRSSSFSGFHVLLQFNLFPRGYLNGYVQTGGGVSFYKPDDYAQERVRHRPKKETFAALSIPAGFGVDVFVFRNIAANLEFSYHFLFDDNLDAFSPDELRDAHLREVGTQLGAAEESEGNDGYFTLTLGAKVFLFENDDIDGDHLVNVEEERRGTNPYDSDTDGDGLTDYDEILKHATNPLDKDSDGDGLTDYVEVVKYRTSASEKDSDADGVEDAEEVQTLLTNPLNRDSDSDSLSDGREVLLATNPNLLDSDRDGLDDFTEVERAHTDPKLPDTDGDGLPDFVEYRAHHTDPLRPDTDNDLLNDFDEIVKHHTNPLAPDTDGDTLDDFQEIASRNTDPLKRDTDGDGMTDERDVCPRDPETYNGFQDTDGCPDTGPKDANLALSSGPGARTPERVIRARSASDTIRITEGQIITLFGVNFEVDKDIIRPESYPILEENAKLFTVFPELEVEIRGHTDSDASDEYNLDLSDRRSISVKNFLTRLGVDPSRMRTRGFGESLPLVPNTDAFGKARNRRIEFYILRSGPRSPDAERLVPIDTTRQISTPR
ncbi:MAG: OmpA family protein [Ignavibacteriae bacterium]|nr:OmpA family protein [Ignavibacteriota bacterium]